MDNSVVSCTHLCRYFALINSFPTTVLLFRPCVVLRGPKSVVLILALSSKRFSASHEAVTATMITILDLETRKVAELSKASPAWPYRLQPCSYGRYGLLLRARKPWVPADTIHRACSSLRKSSTIVRTLRVVIGLSSVVVLVARSHPITRFEISWPCLCCPFVSHSLVWFLLLLFFWWIVRVSDSLSTRFDHIDTGLPLTLDIESSNSLVPGRYASVSIARSSAWSRSARLCARQHSSSF